MQGHLFLLGFMGSGKTRLGKQLASYFARPFIDLDELIVTGEQQSVAAIFASQGEAGFRALEQQYLQALAGQPNAVVSLGGGTPCFFDNMDWVNRHGRSIYLKVPLETLIERLERNAGQRPLLAQLPRAEWPQALENLLRLRAPFYEQAHQTVEYVANDPVFFERLCVAAQSEQ